MYSTISSSRFSRRATRRSGNANLGVALFSGAAAALLIGFTILLESAHPAVAYAATERSDRIERREPAMPAIPGAPANLLGLLGSIQLKATISPFASKWSDLKQRVESERALYAGCEAGTVACPPKMKRWRELLASLRALPAMEQVQRVNREINQMVAYRDDPVAFGKVDHWATPLESFRSNGDCEDYAILKFYSLLELGFGEDQLRLAIVRDNRRRLMHAVTTVEVNGKTYVLDNLFNDPVEHQYVLKYTPSYSANLTGQWVHIVTNEIRAKFVEQIQNQLARAATDGDTHEKTPASPAASRRLSASQPAKPAVEYKADEIALRNAWT